MATSWREKFSAVQSFIALIGKWFTQHWCASKQVMEIAGTFYFNSRYEQKTELLHPSCMVENETCSHILQCREECQVKALEMAFDTLEDGLEDKAMDPILQMSIIGFARRQGEISMEYMYHGYMQEYRNLGRK